MMKPVKTMNDYKKIIEKLKESDDITILTHVRPDGDTLGSAFALMHALISIGKKAKVLCDSSISPRYRFISNGRSDINGDCTGMIVCVDVAAPEMAGKYADFAENADVVIDHHGTNTGYGRYNLIDSGAAACGEIMLCLIEQICEITPVIAQCLYTAISTDTGCFAYSNTTANTHLAAAKLITAGADAVFLNKHLFRTKSHASFEIERRAFDCLEYYHDNTVTCMPIMLNWICELHATEDDMESLSSVPAQIEGVKASATFRQIDVNTYKLSVRTNGEIDGAAVCKKFGGGGHKMAAGCTLHGDYNELKLIVADSLYGALQK